MEREKGMKRESIFCYMSAPSLVLTGTTLKTVCLNVIATGSEDTEKGAIDLRDSGNSLAQIGP